MAFTIEHSEWHGWPRWRWRQGEFYGERKLLCAWDDQATLAQELDTYPNNVWPYPGGSSDALAFDIESRPFPARITQAGTTLDPRASYQHALLTVRYTTKGPTYVNGNYVEEWFEPWQERHQADWTKLAWDGVNGQGLRPNEAPTGTYYGIVYVQKFTQLTTPPADTLSFVGYINANAVACYTFNRIFGAETLLYGGCTLRRRVSAGGSQKWSISRRFLYKYDGWNKVWRLDKGVFGGYDDCFIKDPGGRQLLMFPKTVF
jgi:hypothetical protein